MRKVLLLTALFAACLLLTGCSIMETGPSMVKATLEQSGAAARAMLATYQPDEMSVDVHAGVNDPTYIVETFVGHGLYVRTLLTLKGADVSFGLASAGHGLPIDREFAQEVTAIIGNSLLSEEQRLNRINEAIVSWLARSAAKDEPAADVPVPASQPAEIE